MKRISEKDANLYKAKKLGVSPTVAISLSYEDWRDAQLDSCEEEADKKLQQMALDYDTIIKSNKELHKEKVREILDFANRCLELALHGDYSNGIEAFGTDEGRVRAVELLDRLDKEGQALKQEVNDGS